MMKLVKAAVMAAILFAVATFVALAQEGGELVPIIDRLPNEVLLFGASGGAIVSLLISVLKHFGVVSKSGPLTPQLANFALSVVVAALASIVAGQSVGAAFLTALASMIAASGLHETVVHSVAKTVGNR